MIRLVNATKIYDNRKMPALNDITLDIKDNEYVSVMGKSGSGKSTLLNIIGGMDYMTSGQYFYNDTEINKLSKKELHIFRQKHISFVFQNYALMNQYTVYKNIELPLLARKVTKSERKKIVNEVVSYVGLEAMVNEKPAHISGGEQQRCAIARALAADGDIILADEPTGALDRDNGLRIMEVLEDIHKNGKTIIVITHDNDIASRADKIIRLSDGKIIE
jgi:putative ABC transport system ATP-binding protein